jgi:hypothetical protein
MFEDHCLYAIVVRPKFLLGIFYLVQATKEKKPTKKKDKKTDKEEVPAAAVESVTPIPSSATAPVDIQPPPPIAAPSAVDESKDSRDDKRDESKAHEPKRAQRGMSNVFALFNQSQIQEFKEVIINHSIDSAPHKRICIDCQGHIIIHVN